MVTLTDKEWADIYNRLAKDWPASYLLIREVTRRELGFVVRRHEEWHERQADGRDVGYGTKYRTEHVCLDFYDDAKETWFRLRYLDRE
jgi:hypothetical protein